MNYLTTDIELTSIANAIRNKGGTTATLNYPIGYVTAINDISVGGEVWAAISVTYPTGSVCTATNGTTTLTAADTSGQVVFGIPEPSSTLETWTVSCTDGTDSDSTTVDIAEYGQIAYGSLAYIHIYGVEWDGTSTTLWTRTDLSENFIDPVPYAIGVNNYGSPFDNIYPWKNMTIVEDSQAGSMVKIPKFWYKLTQSGNGIKIQISNNAIDGFSVCPACMDRGDGALERDYILVGRYHCSSSYKSTTGVKPLVSQTRSAFRTGIQGLSSNIYMMDFATTFTIWLLYLVEYANWNSQNVIGYGCGNASSTENMGYTDSMPYHTGTMKNSRGVFGVGTQYRYIEGLWDNVFDWIDGCYTKSNGFNIILNPSNFSDTANGTSVGTPTNGYPSRLTVTNITNLFPIFIPIASSGSDSTYVCDQWMYNTSNPCTFRGGYYVQNLSRGMFYLNQAATTTKDDHTSARLMKLP